MKLIQKISLVVFVACLATFFALPFTGTYTLTNQSLEKSITGYTRSGQSEHEILSKEFSQILNKTYSSSFSFVAAFNQEIKNYNNKVSDEIKIQNNYDYILTKNSISGFLSDQNNKNILFFICFILSSIAALLYFFPFYIPTPAGIKNNGIYHSSATNKGWIALIALVALLAFYYFIYVSPQYIVNWVVLVDPLSQLLSGSEASQWFLYGFLYCTVMITMGIRMIWKYKGNTYQLLRTASIVFFQVAFAFLLPNLVADLHGSDLKNIWPLDWSFFESEKITRHLSAEAPISATTVYLWGIALFLIGVPVFTYFFGKRWYCSWVCGCGGLAETLGDPYRQNSSKKLVAWKIERILIHAILLFAFVMTLLLILSHLGYFDPGAAGFVKYIYGIAIGTVFSGILGTGLYPILGSRFWCRFGCPLAAYIGIWQKKKSKFRITTNGGQCISCGNCSTYCEMGIDVRSYAQKGQNIVRSSCVGCGVCSSVCPRGVLKLENGPTENRVAEFPEILGLTKTK
jgi:ferredoxin-type protein NapH